MIYACKNEIILEIMDEKEFEGNSFKVSQWINKALLPNEHSNIQEQISMTIKKLQITILETSSLIETTNQEIFDDLPNLLNNIGDVQTKASEVKKQLFAINQELLKTEDKPAASLIELEKKRKRLDATIKALKDADSWSTIVESIDLLFESGDLSGIAAKISKLSASLGLWVQSPDHKQKQEILEDLKNRLEAAVGPKLLAALHENDLEKIKSTINIMRSIDRSRQSFIYVSQHRRGSLHKKWKEASLLAAKDGKFEWYFNFLDNVSTEWNQQNIWLESMASRDLDIQSNSFELLADVFAKLEPTPSTILSDVLQGHGNKLVGLESLRTYLDRFCVNLCSESVSKRCKLDVEFREKIYKLVQQIFYPYKQLISQYVLIEAEKFPVIQFKSEDCFDALREVKQTTISTFVTFYESLRRCQQLTADRHLVVLTKAMVTHLIHYLGAFQLLFDAINRRKQADDFSNCDLCLRFIESLGDVLVNLAKLDTDLTNQIKKLKDMEPPFCHLEKSDYVIIGDDVRAEVDLVLVSVKKGENIVLNAKKAYSGLNTEAQSAAFELIFKPIEKMLRSVSSINWNKESLGLVGDLPAFSYSPQEYITQVGQYLMTLPQHLETYTNADHPGLIYALNTGALPYFTPLKSEEQNNVSSLAAEIVLECLGRGLCEQYADKILKLGSVGEAMKPQLLADIEYLSNIFEDMGLELSSPLCEILSYLKGSETTTPFNLKETLEKLFR
ncbi:conserved oligomeric Golgi complex subunit 7-like [Artemia franciscana]